MIHEAPRFIYNFHEGPVSTPPDQFLKKVIEASPDEQVPLNCQLFTSAVTRARGFFVPDYYRSSEHYDDPEGFLKELSPSEAKQGDIVGFSGSPKANPRWIHVGVIKEATLDELTVVHASKEAGTVEVTPLDQLQQRKYHETLRFIKRPITVFEGRQPNTTALRKLKFLS